MGKQEENRVAAEPNWDQFRSAQCGQRWLARRKSLVVA
jgi:hypothetical protein